MKHEARRVKRDFERFATANMDGLFAAALRLTRSESDAEDLVQESLLRALQNWERIREGSNPRAYLNRILVNVFINGYRRRQTYKAILTEAGFGALDDLAFSSTSRRAWSDPVAGLEHRRLSAPVERALALLPPMFRVVLVLADMMDFTYSEIADHLGIPAGTVMSRLHRARRRMREALTAEGACVVASLGVAGRKMAAGR